MAYKRPLTKRQSIIISILWFIFAIWYLWHVPFTLMSILILALSALVVFYPIAKSLREGGGKGNSGGRSSSRDVKRDQHKVLTISSCSLLLGGGINPLSAQCEYAPKVVRMTASEQEKQEEKEKQDKIKLSGYLQAQAQWGEEDAELRVGAKHKGQGAFSRVGLRRGRLKVAYKERWSDLVFQIDMTERGVTLKDAYLKVQAPWIRPGKTFVGLDFVGLTLGIFDRPFGQEIRYSSSRRESPERSHIFNALFPGERDLGAMLSLRTRVYDLPVVGLARFNWEAGLFAGRGVHEESDSRRDVITRLSLRRAKYFAKWNWLLGLSYYHGFVQQSTPRIYRSSPEGYRLDVLTDYEGFYAKRRYYGVDAQVCYTSILGRTELKGEYLWGMQPSSAASFRSPNSASPAEGDIYLRPFAGGYLQLVQGIGKLPLSLVVKYDWLDPNVDINPNHQGLLGLSPTDLAVKAWGFGLVWDLKPALRLQTYYDLNERERSTQLPNHNRLWHDDVLTLRLQYKF